MLSIQGKRAKLKIDHKIQLLKTVCRKRQMDMQEINNIIYTWEVISSTKANKENREVEPIGVDEAIDDFLGEY